MLINGTTIKLRQRSVTSVNAFGANEYTYTECTVDNVLVNVTTAIDQPTTDNYNGKKQTICICVPKDDAHVWEGGKVQWRGHWYDIVGLPIEGDNEKMPLAWNKKYTGERYG